MTARRDLAAFDPIVRYCPIVVDGFRDGSVVPFLGAGANLCGRPKGAEWREGNGLYPPSGAELTAHLAGKPWVYPESDGDLLRVSQWVELVSSPGRLFGELHKVFNHDYPPNRLHEFLAELPGILRKQGAEKCGQLVLTTNYDDVLERAFAQAGEPVDVVVYETRKGEPRFVHLKPDGARVPIDSPATYREFALEQRSVILKIHGQVDRGNPGNDTFVITDDHYIDYLAGTDVRTLIPTYLIARLGECDLLFLGYSLRDWNLRVILRQIKADQGIQRGGWSIQLRPGELDERFWARQRIEVIDAALEDWVDGMRRQLG
jgi:SIR2-like domain